MILNDVDTEIHNVWGALEYFSRNEFELVFANGATSLRKGPLSPVYVLSLI